MTTEYRRININEYHTNIGNLASLKRKSRSSQLPKRMEKGRRKGLEGKKVPKD